MNEVIEVAAQSLDQAAHTFGEGGIGISWAAILTRIAVAAVILLAGLVVLFLLKKLLRHVFHKRSRQDKQQKTLYTLLSNALSFVVYFAMACMALSALGVNVESILAVAGVGGVAIGFGCQTLVKDFVSGLFLWLEGELQLGDTVTVAGQTGTVEEMHLRTTTLRGMNGVVFTVPNGDIRTVVNMTRDYRMAMVDVQITHNHDYGRAMEALQKAMDDMPMEHKPKVLGLSAGDRFAVTIHLECKCPPQECLDVERNMRQAALECLKKEGFLP